MNSVTSKEFVTFFKQMIQKITPTNPNYDRITAEKLANKWDQTDEKWMMIMDTFELSNHDYRVEQWVDFIEDKFEKILK